MTQSAVSVSEKCDSEKMPMEKKMSCCGTVCSDCEYYRLSAFFYHKAIKKSAKKGGV